jgi:hypothetical protein
MDCAAIRAHVGANETRPRLVKQCRSMPIWQPEGRAGRGHRSRLLPRQIGQRGRGDRRHRRGHREDAHVLRAQEVGGVRSDCLGTKATSSAHGIGCVLDQLLALLSEDIGSVLMGGAKICQRQLPLCHFGESSRDFRRSSSLDIGCPLEQVARGKAERDESARWMSGGGGNVASRLFAILH